MKRGNGAKGAVRPEDVHTKNMNALRFQKSKSQKRFREAVAGEEQVGGTVKKRRKNAGAEVLPEVSRVEVEEVGWSHSATLKFCYSTLY